MEKIYLNLLACPKCAESLKIEIEEENHKEVLNGKLECLKCSTNYLIQDGIPVLLYYPHTDKSQEGVHNMFNETPYGLIGAKEAMQNKEKINITALQTTPWHLQEDEVKDKLILEAGCGGGHLYTELYLNGAKVIGLDQTLNSLQHIQKLFRDNNKTANVVCGNIEQIPFKKEVFDKVTSMGVIHHTPNTEKALEQLANVMKQTGTLHIMVYHKHSVWNYVKNTLRFLCRKSKTFSNTIFFLTKYWQGETKSQSNTETVFRDNIVNPITKSYSLLDLTKIAKNAKLNMISTDRREIVELYFLGKKIYNSKFLRIYEKKFGWFLYAKMAKMG